MGGQGRQHFLCRLPRGQHGTVNQWQGVHRVDMGIDKTGEHHTTGQIHDLRLWLYIRFGTSIVTHKGNTIPLNG
jgi:hypothetical protein